MAYDREHVLLTWGGQLPGDESWVCSLRTAPVPVVPGAVNISDGDLEGLLPAYSAAVQAFHQSADTHLSQLAYVSWIKVAAIDQDGKYKQGQQSVREEVLEEWVSGAEVGLAPPNQVALCISTVTAAPRGLASKGRFYLPLPVVQIDPTEGLMGTEVADDIRDSVKTFLEAIADVPGIDTDISPTPCVMSKVGAGTTRKIIGAKVGRALDTQQRRRRSLPENYRIAELDTGIF